MTAKTTLTRDVTCPECYQKFPVTFHRATIAPTAAMGRVFMLGLWGFFVDNWTSQEQCPKCHFTWKIERSSWPGSNKLQRVMKSRPA